MLVLLVSIALLLQFPSHWGSQAVPGYIGNDVALDVRSSSNLVLPQIPQPEPIPSIRGKVIDELGDPIAMAEVELLPINSIENDPWDATKTDWTEGNGEFRFVRIDPGEYIVAIHQKGPDAKSPFLGSFYPGVDDKTKADRVLVFEGSTTELHSVRLRRVETVTLHVKVAFEDGSIPAWSSVPVSNVSHPRAIWEATGVGNGAGTITLPAGFEYYTRAAVLCDAGARIETRESRPVQRINIDTTHPLDALTFIIPGPGCKLWSPR